MNLVWRFELVMIFSIFNNAFSKHFRVVGTNFDAAPSQAFSGTVSVDTGDSLRKQRVSFHLNQVNTLQVWASEGENMNFPENFEMIEHRTLVTPRR